MLVIKKKLKRNEKNITKNTLYTYACSTCTCGCYSPGMGRPSETYMYYTYAQSSLANYSAVS